MFGLHDEMLQALIPVSWMPLHGYIYIYIYLFVITDYLFDKIERHEMRGDERRKRKRKVEVNVTILHRFTGGKSKA